MNPQTIARLNEVNRQFYETTATDFDATRGRAWSGWSEVLPLLPESLGVLDVGCGNGRFGLFLSSQRVQPFTYHGLDNNQALLDYAQAALEPVTHIKATLTLRDVVLMPPDRGTYSLVVLFGVIHHIPGAENRMRFMELLSRRVARGGLLVFASWRFYEYERFKGRIVPWPEDLDVEANDFLLDWRRGERALRYCHYVDDAEQRKLIDATGFTEVTTYRADGFTGDVNCYSILRRE